jgi:KUP system potassium uptake protein
VRIVILGAVFLCTTGAEALYSDLGHCGAKNIRVSWAFVKIMLILNYLGQGAWLLTNYNKPGFSVVNPFFGIMEEWMIIPGNFSNSSCNYCQPGIDYRFFTIFSEAMSLNLWPNQKIDYPSGVKADVYSKN